MPDRSTTLQELMKSRRIAPRDTNFAQAWEARAFALALTLSESERFTWEEFSQHLIAEVARSDAAAAAGKQPVPSYYECWLTALEKVLAAKGLVTDDLIDSRADSIAANPPAPTRATSSGPVKIA